MGNLGTRILEFDLREGMKNSLVSPLVVHAALAPIAKAASGHSRAEFDALGMDPGLFDRVLKSQVEALTSATKHGVDLSLASKIWSSQGSVKKPFVEQCREKVKEACASQVPAEAVDNLMAFEETTEQVSGAAVNEWAEKATKNNIKKLLDGHQVFDWVIASALYMAG